MSNLYKVGGALPLDAPSYIRRQADHDLYEGLLAGEFCYVLNSRQMGKSSLRVQTMRRLQEAGVACAAIDITKVGSQGVTSEEWYAGVLFTLINQLHLPLTLQQFEDWWEDHRLLSPVNRFSEFIDGVLLEEIAGRIVIFIDEIDSVLQLDFKDDFFAAIRACYNKRADNPDYDRLTFALLGVATPSNLIQDKNRTPFNIGRAVQLNGFQFEEARSLAQGLTDKAVNPETVLQAILKWTGGQPFLTQKLCQLVLASNDSIAEGQAASQIEQLVQSRIIENWESQDEPEHLRTIRDRLLNNEQKAGRLLGIYQHVLQNREIEADASFDHMELGLSGLVVKQQSKLKVYNLIYSEVFTQYWIEQSLNALRPYATAITNWFASNRADESLLLRGQTLQNAQEWAEGKSLDDQDYQFLAASQELERRDVQLALDAEREANEIFAQAQRRANHRIRIGSIVLTISLLGAALAAILAGTTNRNLVNARTELGDIKQEKEQLSYERKNLLKEKNKLGELVRAGELNLKKVTQSKERAYKEAKEANQNLAETQSTLAKANQQAQKANQKTQQALKETEVAKQVLQEAKGETLTAQKELTRSTEQLSEVREIIRQVLAASNEDLVVTRTETGTRATLRGDGSRLALSLERVQATARAIGISEVEYLKIRATIQTPKLSEANVLPAEKEILAQFTTELGSSIQLGQELAQLRRIPEADLTPSQRRRLIELFKLRDNLARQFNQFIEQKKIVESLERMNRSSGGQILAPRELGRLNNYLTQSNAALLYPIVLDDRIEVLITVPNTPPLRRTVLVTRKELSQVIVQFRELLTHSSSALDEVIPYAKQLYIWLIKPVEADLKQAGVKTILYAPDGPLRYIPLSALYSGQRWLIEDYVLNNINTLSVTDFGRKPISKLRVLAGAFGTGGLRSTSNGRNFVFEPLPFATREVKQIAEIIPGTKILLGENFTQANVFSQVDNYNVIHLATHSVFLPGNPKDSFIVFGDGNLLTSNDIRTLNLSNTDLVVLSASETGLGGQLADGVEVLSMGYMMQEAGARAVISSLWSVNDSSTQVLMDNFYTSLQQGNPIAEALRQAQIAAIKDHNTFNHPYYWAPFILVGNGL